MIKAVRAGVGGVGETRVGKPPFKLYQTIAKVL